MIVRFHQVGGSVEEVGVLALKILFCCFFSLSLYSQIHFVCSSFQPIIYTSHFVFATDGLNTLGIVITYSPRGCCIDSETIAGVHESEYRVVDIKIKQLHKR